MNNKILTFDEIMKYHSNNIVVYEEIKDNLEALVPFIGAGLSAFVYPLWKQTLIDLSDLISKERSKIVIKGYIEKNDLENAAQKIETVRGKFNLSKDLLTIFSEKKLNRIDKELYKQTIFLLPYLFKKQVITTNYDRVIEKVYNDFKLPFDRILLPGHPELIRQTLVNGNRHILYKVHGDISADTIEYSSIIFTKQQYKKNYSLRGKLIKELKEVFKCNKMLFLGCGLFNDRTLDTLKKIIKPGITNYAIISCKEDDINHRLLELGENYNIRAIIYPDCRHEAVRIILEKVLEETDKDMYKMLGYSLTTTKPFVARRFDYKSDIFTLVGRQQELKELKLFCSSNEPILWWSIVGAGGTGKSRLAFELSKELISKNWHIQNLGYRDYDILNQISNRCNNKTLFIVEGAREYIKNILNWLEDLVKEPNSNKIRILFIERDNKKNNNYFSCDELIYLYARNPDYPDIIKKSCYKNKPLELSVLSDDDLKEIMANYARCFGIIFKEEERKKLLNILEIIDKDMKRPLYAMCSVEFCLSLSEKKVTKWTLKEILEYIVKREIIYSHNSIRAVLSNKINEKLYAIVDKIKIIATIYGDIEVDSIKNKYPDIWLEYSNLVNKLYIVESPDEFLETVGLLENRTIKAFSPNLLGEYFVCHSFEKNDNLGLLFIKNWYNDLRILNFLNRIILDYNVILYNNDTFIKYCLTFDNNCISKDRNIIELLSTLILNLAYNDKDIKNSITIICIEKLKFLYTENYNNKAINEALALKLIKALFNLTVREDKIILEKNEIEKIIEEQMVLHNKYPNNEEIIFIIAKTFVNLTVIQDMHGIKKTILKLIQLYKNNESIYESISLALVNLIYAQVLDMKEDKEKTVYKMDLDNVADDLPLSEFLSSSSLAVDKVNYIKKLIKELEKIYNKYPDNVEIVFSYAKGLTNLTFLIQDSIVQEIEGISEIIKKQIDLYINYPNNKNMILIISKTLLNLTSASCIENLMGLINELMDIIVKFMDIEEVAVIYAKTIYNLTLKQKDLYDQDKLLIILEKIYDKYPENETISCELTKVLLNLTARRDLEDINQKINKLQKLYLQYPDNEMIASCMAESLLNLAIREENIFNLEKIIEELVDIHIKYAENEKIILALAETFVRLSEILEPCDIKEIIKEQEKLYNHSLNKEKIALYLSMSLFNLIKKQELLDKENTIKQLEKIYNKYPDNEKIAYKFVTSLLNLMVEQKVSKKSETIKKIRYVYLKYPDNKKIAYELSKALYNLSFKQNPTIKKEIISELNDIYIKYPYKNFYELLILMKNGLI